MKNTWGTTKSAKKDYYFVEIGSHIGNYHNSLHLHFKIYGIFLYGIQISAYFLNGKCTYSLPLGRKPCFCILISCILCIYVY
jgi:hypothetical protein